VADKRGQNGRGRSGRVETTDKRRQTSRGRGDRLEAAEKEDRIGEEGAAEQRWQIRDGRIGEEELAEQKDGRYGKDVDTNRDGAAQEDDAGDGKWNQGCYRIKEPNARGRGGEEGEV
jgi:hypothetical protein